VDHGVPPGPVRLAGDDTVAARPGPNVVGQGRHRDGVRSTPSDMTERWGHPWIVLSVRGQLPLAVRPWALPMVIAWDRRPEWEPTHGTRHRTPAPRARLLWARGRRWCPARQCLVVGDTGDGTREPARGGRHHRRHLTWVGTFPREAALDASPPPRPRRTMGRPRVKGPTLASPPEVVAHTAERTRLTVAWSGGSTRDREVVTGTGHWSRLGADVVDVRWGYVHDATGSPRDESCLTPDITLRPPQMVACAPPRGSMDTTFQEGRDYLRLESTQGYGQATVRQLPPG
jgi:hypothetical protein